MVGRKSDFTLSTNTLDDLFSTQEERDDAKLAKIRDILLTEIDNFPNHPFKVRNLPRGEGAFFSDMFGLWRVSRSAESSPRRPSGRRKTADMSLFRDTAENEPVSLPDLKRSAARW